jgi:hypothetical protein
VHEKVVASGRKTPAALEIRFRRLDEAGFEWKAKDPRHVPWSQRYGELVNFVSRFGHAQVPIGWKEHPKLSNWVSAQVRTKRHMKLSITSCHYCRVAVGYVALPFGC